MQLQVKIMLFSHQRSELHLYTNTLDRTKPNLC